MLNLSNKKSHSSRISNSNSNLNEGERRPNPFTRWYLRQKRPRRIFLSYTLDWLVMIVATLLFFSIYLIRPNQVPFDLNDKAISFPYKPIETVPNWLLVVIGLGVPLLVIFCTALLIRRSPHDLHHGVLGLSLSVALTMAIIILFKTFVGRHRPDWLARCKPIPGAVNPQFGLATIEVCTNMDLDILDEGQRSFASGHTALAFSGFVYLTLYLGGKLHIFDRKGHVYKTLIAIFPLLVATYVGITRIQDFRHHWSDVFVGGLLGTIVSIFTYHQYYPLLTSKNCNVPFTPRIPHDNPNNNLLAHDNLADPRLEMKLGNQINSDLSSSQESTEIRVEHEIPAQDMV